MAWTKNPKPIVIMFNRSLAITDRTKNVNKPNQINATMSTGGNFSVSPVKIATNVGMVARWTKITATQPNVSALR